MKIILLPAILALALCAAFTSMSVSAAERAQPSNSTGSVQTAPESEFRAVIQALRQNRAQEVARLIGHEAGLRADYAVAQSRYAAELKDAEQRDHADPELAKVWSQLHSQPGRNALEAQWFEVLQTQLPAIRARWPMYRAMAHASLVAGELPIDSQASFSELLLALDHYMLETDFSDRAKLHATVSDLSVFAQSSGLADFYDLRSLPFDQMLELAERGMATSKRIALRYGLNADAVLESYEVTSTRSSENRAQLRQSVKVLGVPVVWYQELAWDGQAWVEPQPSPEEQAASEAAGAAEANETLEEIEAASATIPDPPTHAGKCAPDAELKSESGTEF